MSAKKVSQACQQPPFERWGFLNLGILSCDTNPLCGQHLPGPAFSWPHGTWEARKHEANAGCCARSQFSVSDPGASDVLPASTQLPRAHMLAQEKEVISAPSQFLTIALRVKFQFLNLTLRLCILKTSFVSSSVSPPAPSTLFQLLEPTKCFLISVKFITGCLLSHNLFILNFT